MSFLDFCALVLGALAVFVLLASFLTRFFIGKEKEALAVKVSLWIAAFIASASGALLALISYLLGGTI